MTREQINAEAWLNNSAAMNCKPAPQECQDNPSVCSDEFGIWRWGFYRKLANGKIEFLAFCKAGAGEMTAFKTKKLNELLDALLPKEQSNLKASQTLQSNSK